jgi:hypothetical protein
MRALIVAVAVAAIVLAGCGSSRPIFDTASDEHSDQRRKDVAAEIKALANGKDPKEIEKDLVADQAKERLIARGSAIEPQLIEALGGDEDWAVRLGVIEVLEAVGTRGCVEALIRATADDQPLVALRANKLLEVMCEHREIPAPGDGIGPNDLPPFSPPADDQALEARLAAWKTWHAAHGEALRKAWNAWWATNRNTVVIR